MSELEDAVRAFSEIDLDGDGFITPREMKKYYEGILANEQIDLIFKLTDADHDRRIDFEEFAPALAATVAAGHQSS
ncbi:EF-hand domain-containing protein [Phytomonospora sp. NPDC050363]|uniref:EF-hand domain-containing protein n=1 Tax=Phytomonospora sp. NPDC050363 TaxID=3155642 RepID=UPI0033DF6F16